MTADTPRALPPIDYSAREIRVLDFSRTFYPCFRGSKISCSMTTVSLRGTPPKYTIISRVPSPGEEEVEGLVVDGRPTNLSANLVSAFRTLSDQGTFLSMSFPVYLWIEEVCADRESAEEVEYLQSITPDLYKKATGLICQLGEGDQKVRTFLRVAYLIFRHIYRSGPGTRDLPSFRSIFTFLRKRNPSESNMPRTLVDYSELTAHFFNHPYWKRLRSLREYLSVKGLGLIYEDVLLWDCNLLEVGMMILQQEEGLLPRQTIPPAGLIRGSARDRLLAGLRCWRGLVQWELVRLFLRLHAEGSEPLAWHYLAQLALQICSEDALAIGDTYLELLCCMLHHGHPWSVPSVPVERGAQGRGLMRWLKCVSELCASGARSPRLWRSVSLDDLLSVSQTHLSDSPLFFLTHAGIGFHCQPEHIPSWMPNYNAIPRSPARVPLTFEDPKTYAALDYCRHNPNIQQGSLVISGAKVGQLAEAHEIPEPKDILDLFAFLRTVPTYEVTSEPHREGTRDLVKQILLALHQDPHGPPSGAALHRCVGTLLLAPHGPINLRLLRLLDLEPSDDITIIVDRVRDKFLPGVGGSATDSYGWADAARAGAVCLAEERIRDVRRYYKLGRVPGGKWGLVPAGARIGDGIYKVEGYGAQVVLRSGEGGYRLVGACGIGAGESEVLKEGWKKIEIR